MTAGVSFIISDGWDEQALLELKERIGAYFLVGLQIDDDEFEHLDVVEGVVSCGSDEVNDVIRLLDVNFASTLIAIDVVDIKSLFERGYSFQFIQACAKDESESDLVKVATQTLVSQLAKAHNTKGLFVGMEGVESPSLDTLSYISEAVENALSIDNEFIYYSASIIDEPNCFGLRAICALE